MDEKINRLSERELWWRSIAASRPKRMMRVAKILVRRGLENPEFGTEVCGNFFRLLPINTRSWDWA